MNLLGIVAEEPQGHVLTRDILQNKAAKRKIAGEELMCAGREDPRWWRLLPCPAGFASSLCRAVVRGVMHINQLSHQLISLTRYCPYCAAQSDSQPGLGIFLVVVGVEGRTHPVNPLRPYPSPWGVSQATWQPHRTCQLSALSPCTLCNFRYNEASQSWNEK